MTISCSQGGKTLAQLSGAQLTPLQIQKVLYFANMLYIGGSEKNKRLVRSPFLTWRYGPVVRELYERLSEYGDSIVPVSAFDDIVSIMDDKGNPTDKKYEREVEVLKDAYKRWGGFPAWRLVEISHWDEGAWQKSVDKQEEEISDDLIWGEYNARYNQQ